jgi:hypothetical protein
MEMNDLLKDAMTRETDKAALWRTEFERVYRVNAPKGVTVLFLRPLPRPLRRVSASAR